MWNNAVRGIFETIKKLGEDKFNEFRNKVNKALNQYKSEEGISFNMKVIYTYGKK